jgi:hypothetical protein
MVNTIDTPIAIALKTMFRMVRDRKLSNSLPNFLPMLVVVIPDHYAARAGFF